MLHTKTFVTELKKMYMATVFIRGITNGDGSVSFRVSSKVFNISVFQKYWSSELLQATSKGNLSLMSITNRTQPFS